MTLQDLKRQRGLTNAQIGRMLGCSANTAGTILQGRHIHVYTDAEIEKLAQVLGVTFERCWMAMCESYNAWRGTPGAEHARYDVKKARVQAEMGVPVEQPRVWATVDSWQAIESEA